MSLRDSKGTPESVRRLLDGLSKLPGIGKRSAERIAFFLIKENTGLLVIDCTVTSGTQSAISLAAMMSPLVDLAIFLKMVQPIGKMHTPSLH